MWHSSRYQANLKPSVHLRVHMLHSLFFLSPDPGLDLNLWASSRNFPFVICCPAGRRTSLLPLHCYLFLLPGPDRWECSGIKASVFTTLFTSIGTSPFGHVGPRKRGAIPSSASYMDYRDHSGLMRDSSPVGAILQTDRRCVSVGIHCTDPQVMSVTHTVCSCIYHAVTVKLLSIILDTAS